MSIRNIPYQSFCWVIGTTSFRTAKLNLKIEHQLQLLDEFQSLVLNDSIWVWEKSTQERYYDFMKEKSFLSGEASRKDKDAREKTSGLVDIGLITSEREITDSGRELLNITSEGIFEIDNVLNIDRDSFVYLKQLIKTNISVNRNNVRPFLVVIKSLIDLEYLTYDELAFLVPLINDNDSYKEVINNVNLYRKNRIKLEDVIYQRLISMDNYKLALKTLLDNEVDENLVCLIGMNRKSRNYDKSYYRLYEELKRFFLYKESSHETLLDAVGIINQKPGFYWKKLLFETTNLRVIRQNIKTSISSDCPFIDIPTEEELKKVFFKYLHIFKAMATLSDYFDLNRRYFNLTDILIFEDNLIKLDLLPKYFFKEVINEIFVEAFSECDKLKDSVSLIEISKAFDIDMGIVYFSLSNHLGVTINSPEQAAIIINDERYKRFNNMIDKKFSDPVLIELLDCFEKRDDKRIEELVTDEATIPTIFEYILGVIWYKISEREGNILDFMKLSLEANLLPKTHATGGYADIVYEYETNDYYPKHSLLIEATLSDGNNQRRMEMEPVSRHLGDYRIRNNNPFDYSVFISTYLDENVINDFRYRKTIPYSKDGATIMGMKIISVDTDALKRIIKNKTTYKHLHKIFEKFYDMPLETQNWHERLINEVTGTYNVHDKD